MTTPIAYHQGTLQLSADVGTKGYVKVRLFDKQHKRLAESKPLQNNFSNKKLEWLDGFTFEKIEPDQLQMEIEFRDAIVYSFSFSAKK